MNEIRMCNLCKAKHFKRILESNDLMYNIKRRYTLSKCLNCGLIFVNPQPSTKDLEKHYPRNYYSFFGETRPISKFEILLYRTYGSSNGNIFFKLLLLPFKRTIRTLNIPSHKEKNVKCPKFLDVGCGSGNFLRKAKTLGFECYGVEPGEFDKKFAEKNGFMIFSGTLKDAKYPQGFFDDITFNHVFEHVEDPLTTLKESKRILKKGGIINITVPQGRNLAFWLFRRYWVQLDVPRHLFIYDESTLREYAKQAGLEVKSVRYISSSFQFTGSLIYIARARGWKFLERFFRGVGGRIFFAILYPIAFICNRLRIGDTIEIVLKK